MLGFKSISYEEMRLEYFMKQRDAAERRMNYWCRPKQADRVGWMEASDRASEAGAQYSFYEDALKALENQPKWISVEERLPGDPLDGVGDVVELLIDKGDVKEVLPGYYDHDEKDWVIYFGDILGDYRRKAFSWWRVIKWRPLPEPPKEEV